MVTYSVFGWFSDNLAVNNPFSFAHVSIFSCFPLLVVAVGCVCCLALRVSCSLLHLSIFSTNDQADEAGVLGGLRGSGLACGVHVGGVGLCVDSVRLHFPHLAPHRAVPSDA